MAASTDLTTLAKVKTRLGVSGSGDDTLLDALIDAASEAIESHCKRKFNNQSHTEFHDGGGQSFLVLRQRPITSITSIHDDPNWDYLGSDLVDADLYTYYGDEGIVQLSSGTFQDGYKNVKVIYVAGYSTIPTDIDEACQTLVASWYHKAKQGAEGLSNERLGDYAVSYAKSADGLPPQVEQLLEQYKEVAV